MNSESSNSVGGDGQERSFDLEERTGRFGEDVIRFCRRVRPDPVNSPLITQLVKAGTSVGANYSEANETESKKNFRHKIGISEGIEGIEALHPHDGRRRTGST